MSNHDKLSADISKILSELQPLSILRGADDDWKTKIARARRQIDNAASYYNLCNDSIANEAVEAAHAKIDEIEKECIRRLEKVEAAEGTPKGCFRHIAILVVTIVGIGMLYITNAPQKTSKDSGQKNVVETAENKGTSLAPKSINQLLSDWDSAHNTKDITHSRDLYGENVYYYQSNYTREKVITSKQKLFKKYPNFHQESLNAKTTNISDDCIRLDFDKQVWTDYPDCSKKVYPSYLIITRHNKMWQITTESDLITDRNLANKK